MRSEGGVRTGTKRMPEARRERSGDTGFWAEGKAAQRPRGGARPGEDGEAGMGRRGRRDQTDASAGVLEAIVLGPLFPPNLVA